MSRINSRCFFLCASALYLASLSDSQESCLGPGFTERIPPQEELSQYSATVLKPGDKAVYIALSFRCNGTLVSLTIPSQVRGSDYSRVDNYLEPYPSIWRCNGTLCYLLDERTQRQRVPGTTGSIRSSRELRNGEVISFTFTVTLQVDIQAGDVLGFRLNALGDDGRIEHLPLLYKPGPTPGSFTPIVIADFNPAIVISPSPSTSSSSREDPIVTQTSASTLMSSSKAEPVMTPTLANFSSNAEVWTSLFDSPFVTAGITAVAVQLEVLLAILVTACIVYKCRRKDRNYPENESVKTRTAVIRQNGPLTTPNNLSTDSSDHVMHEYDYMTMQFQTKYPSTQNGGNVQDVQDDAPIDEYYDTGKLPNTGSTSFSYI